MRQASHSENRWSTDNIPTNSEELVKYARDVASRYATKKQDDGLSEQRRNTLQSLAKLHEFRYLYINGVAEQALEVRFSQSRPNTCKMIILMVLYSLQLGIEPSRNNSNGRKYCHHCAKSRTTRGLGGRNRSMRSKLAVDDAYSFPRAL